MNFRVVSVAFVDGQVIQLIAAIGQSSSLRERILQTFGEVSKRLQHYELVAEEYAQFFAEHQVLAML